MGKKRPPYVDPFDLGGPVVFDPGAIEKQRLAQEAEYNRRDYLIHKVFSQNPDGKKLLNTWVENVLVLPRQPVCTGQQDQTPFDIGIRQGKQDFVRGILKTIKKVEEG